MAALARSVLDIITTEFSFDEPVWESCKNIRSELQFLDEECNKDSEFDPHNRRKKMYEDMMNGYTFVVFQKCLYGQVFAVFETQEQLDEMPWGLWGRIFRLFYDRKGKPFKVFFLANTHLREFPPDGEEIKPQNINGGYTYRCDRETILIYRAEDATRVLIHELQHSCCLDDIEKGLDVIEAETEAWAELFYVGLLSQGKHFIFKDLLQRQSEWMIKQNEKIRKHMKDPASFEFPWRYTIGKEEVWKRWGILREDFVKPYIRVGNSLRLTYPPNNVLKDYFKVKRSSTIL
jgi:hypothetical protein